MKYRFNSGTCWLWLNAGAVSCCLLMLAGLLWLLLVNGLGHFWPSPVVQFTVTADSGHHPVILGELIRTEPVPDTATAASTVVRYLIRQGKNTDGPEFRWYRSDQLSHWQLPPNAAVLERHNGSRWYMVADEQEAMPALPDIARISYPNQMSFGQKLADYSYHLWQFLSSAPQTASAGGGIFPAIFGTVIMVLLMSVIVTPIGVMAAVYLHEYARQGLLVRLIRISVYNLAGVPSIVFGVFGLGFFVYVVGGSIDNLFYADRLPSPVFGTPGLLWVSLTMALLTLPVVIVSVEEGLSRIPQELRMGAYALGATRAEMLWKVILPLATPAMMTGLILAIARAAGEVAPLIFVGVVKLAPSLPVDGTFPYLHLERKIMHLGYQIYDSGLQSPDPDAAQSLVYATALVLVVLILLLNLVAIRVRNRLREKYHSV
ncbi:phosphate ABC transporter permease PstA [Chromatiaceae bacterium AAb-1]|nr:phosphate ABC transporter permease PstA [Chromatiaceae bacterium AAb-1]